MSHIQEDMKELKAIVSELKITNSRAKQLRERKKELEAKVLGYLETTDMPGLKFHELIVMRSESTTHSRMKKKEKEDSIIKVLEDIGVNDAERVCQAISNATIGEEKIISKLKVKMDFPDISQTPAGL